MRKYTTKMLVTLALLAAIGVVLARFIVPMPNPYMRFSIEAVPFIVAGILYGPVPGALVGFVADFVGCLFSGYGYNPVFAVPPVLIGLCAGLHASAAVQEGHLLPHPGRVPARGGGGQRCCGRATGSPSSTAPTPGCGSWAPGPYSSPSHRW